MYKLLIVDDDEVICRGLSQCIDWASIGINIRGVAYNGWQALELLREDPTDIVITDICMPGLDGIELSRLLRDEFPQTKIVLLSAFNEFQYAQRAVSIGVSEYITKPFHNQHLLDTMKRVVQQVEQEQKQRELLRQAAAYCQDFGNHSILHAPDIAERTESRTNGGSHLATLQKYIQEQYAQPDLTIKKVADAIHISTSYLCYLFRKEAKTSFSAYLTQVRMNESIRLLQSTDLRTYEIAERVGYSSPQYFSACFRKYAGMSPNEYRGKNEAV